MSTTAATIDQGADVSKEKWGYEYYDYSTYREQLLSEENNWAEEPDVCYDTAFSILFFVVITLIGFSFGIYSIVLYFKRRNGSVKPFIRFTASYMKRNPK